MMSVIAQARAGLGVLAFLGGMVGAIPAFAACEGVAPEQKLQNTSPQDIGRDLDRIATDGYIEFAVYDDYAPWSFENAGKAEGIDIEIGKIIAGALGVEPRFRLVSAGETLDADLRNYVYKGAVVNGRVSDVMLHVPYDVDYACRFDQVVFTGIYGEEHIAIAYDAASYPDKGPTPAVFRYDPIGVENDSISDFYMTDVTRGPSADKVHRYRNTVLAMKALADHEVMAVMGPRAELEAALAPGTDIHEPPLGLTRSKWAIGVALSMQHRRLGYAVDDAIAAALEDGRIAKAFADYGVGFTPPTR
ncbi:transporter substrate-binding domain-containing protein [Thioclava sp. DLFJ4-1]|uniref:substrate-binding periplasmic protein n=1 Tax=Thioclava sp. DLFJ4-1 TaxID=1915313 RepID=UPI001FEFE887|nr:transporter substrate-binding domain-containing protein [Thioclava sp. DLFJ4-1]